MAITQHLIVTLILVLAVAWIFAALFARFGLPVILGELVAGFILGPSVLGVVTSSAPLELMAEFGIFFGMFFAGMEMDPRELIEHIWPSLGVAIGGFVIPFVLGYFTTRLFGATVYQSLFVGMGLSITAIAVQATLLQNMRILQSELGHIIIGAAIADDILALIALSVLMGLAKTGSFQTVTLLIIVGKVVAFFGLTMFLGHFVVPKITPKLDDREAKSFTFALLAALIMSGLAEMAGLHLIIGAFMAGQFVRKEAMDEEIYRKIRDRFFGLSYGFLMPIFFVSLSFHLHFTWTWSFILLSSSITLVAILGKFLGSGIGGYVFGHSIPECIIIGSGMTGRGAVELVVAAVVLQLSDGLMKTNVISHPLLTAEQFSALVLMGFITTLLAPMLLRWSVMKACHADEQEQFCRLWKQSERM